MNRKRVTPFHTNPLLNSIGRRLKGARKTSLIIICLTPFIMTSYPLQAFPTPPGMVVVPLPSISVIANECYWWTIQETYTATLVPESVQDQLGSYNTFSYTDHFHVDMTPGGVGRWSTALGMAGSPSDKLGTINLQIFGSKEPYPGKTKTFTNKHNGSCAAKKGMRECVGLFVSPGPAMVANYTHEPTTFPFGICSGVPPVGVTCHFDSPTGTVGLGTGGRGTRVGTTTISVDCTEPVVYRVSVLPGAVDPDSLQIVNMTLQGSPPPYVSPGTKAKEHLTIAVEAKVSSEGFLSTQRVLRIDIP